MITQETLEAIVSDTSFNGEYKKFYEMLQEELSKVSDERIRKKLRYV